MLRAFFVFTLLSLCLTAQPPLVCVQDTLTTANGSLIQAGTIQYSNPQFTYGGYMIAPGNITYTVNNGVVNLCFVPGLYTVHIVTVGAPASTASWLIPSTGGPYTMADVVTTVTSISTSAVLNPSQILANGFTTGWVLTVNNGIATWEAPAGGGASMVGATNSTNGVGGAVPAPLAGQQNYLLSGAGLWVTPPVGGVSSFNTRTGAVTATTGDYTASQVTNAVDSTGSYSNPSWLTALAWSKISAPSGTGFIPVTSGSFGSVRSLAYSDLPYTPVPYTGATGDVTLGTHKILAAEFDSTDNTNSGILSLFGKTSGSAVTVTVDDNTAAYAISLPPAAPGTTGQVPMILATGSTNTMIWSTNVPTSTALATAPVGCPSGEVYQTMDAKGNAITCLTIGGSGPTTKNFYYPFCSRDAGAAPTSNGVFGHESSDFNITDGCVRSLALAGGNYMTVHHYLPSTWDSGTITLTLLWDTAQGGSGNVQWNVVTYCANSTSPYSGTYGSPVSVTTAAISSVNLNSTTFSTVPVVGCSPNSLIWIKIYNTASGSGGTTYGNDVYVLGAGLTVVE